MARGQAGLTIRAAEASDLDAIWEIETSVFGAEAWSREMMREELAADFRSYVVLVARAAGAGDEPESDTVHGYGGLLMVGTEGDIQTIAVAPDVRGGGYGRKLMDTLLDTAAAAGVREVFLEVRADNPVAITLYASLGFVELGIRAGYYQPDNVDAIVMRLAMSERVETKERV